VRTVTESADLISYQNDRKCFTTIVGRVAMITRSSEIIAGRPSNKLENGNVRWTTPSGRQYVTEPTRYPI
jgi:hypothetical protein